MRVCLCDESAIVRELDTGDAWKLAAMSLAVRKICLCVFSFKGRPHSLTSSEVAQGTFHHQEAQTSHAVHRAHRRDANLIARFSTECHGASSGSAVQESALATLGGAQRGSGSIPAGLIRKWCQECAVYWRTTVLVVSREGAHCVQRVTSGRASGTLSGIKEAHEIFSVGTRSA